MEFPLGKKLKHVKKLLNSECLWWENPDVYQILKKGEKKEALLNTIKEIEAV